jgi:hypothetical protein
MGDKTYYIPRWVDGKEKFQELYKEFKGSLLKENILEFLKEKIFKPNNIQYKDYGEYLEVINIKDKKAYLFIYYDFDDIDEWDDPYENPILEDVLEYAAEKIDETFERNKTLELENCEAFVISKNAIINISYSTYFPAAYEWMILCFFNKKEECKPDDYSFAKFLKILTKRGIIKNE